MDCEAALVLLCIVIASVIWIGLSLRQRKPRHKAHATPTIEQIYHAIMHEND